MADLNEMITQQRIRSYEISIWTLQDRFLSVLKWLTMDQKGQIQEPEMVLRDDGTEELSFTIPKFYYSGAQRVQNPMWLHLKNQPLEANMHKLKVIFNKNTEDERVFEFLVVSVAQDHVQDRVDINVKAEGLAFHELGKVGYKIAFSEETYQLEVDNWANQGMHGDKPINNIQYWNDLIFKDSDGNWRTNWQYEVKMDWSAYSQGGSEGKDPSRVYEDEYVSSWQLDTNNKLMPRYTEGYKEKYRLVEVSESNIYNATQTIAEQFGVFCRYEYEHDENYQIIGKKVIYYNNYIYDNEGHIDLTYPYSSSSITRTVDNSNITTKMFVSQVEENDNTISIMDVDANKSREDYLLCFDYLKDIQGINEDQYEAIQDYEARMYSYNTSLSSILERINILRKQLVQVTADYATYNNAYALDNERYEEALKGLNSVTGGKQLVPVDTSFMVMEDNENGLGLYIRMRFDGMVASSIQLYAKDNFSSLNGSQYSKPVLFSSKYDEYGELAYLYNLQEQNLKVGDSVYLSGMRDPYSYYEKLMDIWAQRKNIDKEKRDKAQEKERQYYWYLYGSRAGYGLVDSAKTDSAYYGIMTTVPFEATEEELRDYDLAHPFVSWHVGDGRAGESGEIYSYDNEYDHFSEIDKNDTTPDLYYFQEYFLKQKELEYNKLERMLGPALREGYWTPEDYNDYGDSYEATFALEIGRAESLDIDSFNEFIPNSQVQATSPDDILAPHLQLIWDCNKYYEDEEALVYTSSISDNKDQHLIVDLSKYLNLVSEHLDDLCLFYSALPNVETIDDISGEVSGLTHTKRAKIEEYFQWFQHGIYDTTSEVGFDYYSKLKYLINELTTPNENEVNQNPFKELSTGVNELKSAVAGLSNTAYEDLSEEEVQTLIDIANSAYNLKTQYESIVKDQTSIANTSGSKAANAEEAKTFGEDELVWINAAYDYLMDMDTIDWSDTELPNLELESNETYSKQDKGLLVLIRQYQLYNTWLDSLKENCYCSFQINSQAEFGWILDTKRFSDGGYGCRFPALIVTGAKTLDAETIRFITTNEYVVEGETEPRKVIQNRYKPYLGYYEAIKNENGTTSLQPVELVKLVSDDFIGVEQTSTTQYTRNLTKYDYDNNGILRQPNTDEYRYRRVYPRFFFNTIKLKTLPPEPYISVNGHTLENFKEYSLVSDDRSIGQQTYGIGYYLTIKPAVLLQYNNNSVNIDLSYTLSNSDVAIYLDALKVMRENAYPKVSYEVELSVLNPEFVKTAYNRLNQIVHLNDNDLQLEDVSGYISTVTLKLDKPWEDTVEIKNYTTKFEDLFTTIVAQTEAMKKSSQGLNSALQAFSRTTGLIDSDVLYNSMLNANLNLSFNKGTLTIDQAEGIWGTTYNDNGAPSGVVAFRGGGIFTATEQDANGNWIWNTGILSSGINASLITTGQLDTNKIKVYAGDQLRFQLNGEGLYAYKSFTTESESIAGLLTDKNSNSNIDSKQYVVFNSNGLFFTAEAGALYAKTSIDEGTGATLYTYDVLPHTVNRVEVSWKGLILRNWKGEDVFYADPNTGDLILKGEIQSTSGKIAGWEITEHELRNKGLILRSGPSDKIVGIELNPEGTSIDIITDANGIAYYPYNPVGTDSKPDLNTTYYLTTPARDDITLTNGNSYYIQTTKNSSVTPRYQKREITSVGTNPDYGGTNELADEVTLSTSVDVVVNVEVYVMLNRDLTDYAMSIDNKRITYDGNTSLESDWYEKLANKYSSNVSNYVIYTQETVFEKKNVGEEDIVLRPKGLDDITFSVYADTGEVKILDGNIGDFKISRSALSKGTIQGATFSGGDSKIIINNQTTKLGNLFCGVRTDSATGFVYLKRVDGIEENFNIAAMQAYKDAVAAAAAITLKLTVNGLEVVATANTAGGQTITKRYTLDSSGGKVVAIATNGIGTTLSQSIDVGAAGSYGYDSGIENTNICSNCSKSCYTGCRSSCKGECKTSCSSYCIDRCNYSCSTSCTSSCVNDCSGGCVKTCGGACSTGCGNDCGNSCSRGCGNQCGAACSNNCEGECFHLVV